MGYLWPFYCKFTGECYSEGILKICQYLTKLCVGLRWLTFLAHPVYCWRRCLSRAVSFCTGRLSWAALCGQWHCMPSTSAYKLYSTHAKPVVIRIITHVVLGALSVTRLNVVDISDRWDRVKIWSWRLRNIMAQVVDEGEESSKENTTSNWCRILSVSALHVVMPNTHRRPSTRRKGRVASRQWCLFGFTYPLVRAFGGISNCCTNVAQLSGEWKYSENICMKN